MTVDMPAGTTTTDRLVRQVVDRLRSRFPEVSAAMTGLILDASGPLDLAELRLLLEASVEGNLDTGLHLLVNDIPVDHARPSTAAIEYAYRLAEHRIPADALRRAYHLGSEAMRRESFAEVQRLGCSPDEKLHVLHHIDGFLHTYIDWMSAEVLAVHDQETRRLTEYSASATATMVRDVLDGVDVNPSAFEPTTRYRIDQRHRGAVVWVNRANPAVDYTPSLMQMVNRVARDPACNGPVLFTAVDRGSARVWFGVGTDDDLRASLSETLASLPGARIAFGGTGTGADGFRRTHRQALAAGRIARISTRTPATPVSYDDPGVAATAILTENMAGVRTWISEELGGLACITETAERLRETYLCFLDNDSSFTRTGAEMNLHRNTVKYRVEQALELLGERAGEPGGRSRADIAMALHVCRILGTAALGETGE